MEFNVADLLERVASNIPEREAVICGAQRATYQHFDEQSRQFGRYLLSVGLTKGDHVAIYAYNSIEWIVAMLGCYKIGAVPININYRYVEDELLYIFKDADIKAVVYDNELSAKINAVRKQLPLLAHFIFLDNQNAVAEFPEVKGSVSFSTACACKADVTFPPRSADDHYVLYTGGTTGFPKGVVWRHNADGTITMLGRGSQCINSGGEKIYPEEVEMAIKAHPDVQDTLVAATPDDRFGQCVTALVQLRPGVTTPSMESLHEACKTHIARYKLPRRVYYVDSIKRAPSGKADYRWAKGEVMRLFSANS